MTSEITAVKSFFASMQVHLSEIWLESCINWCKSDSLPRSCTPQELQSKVYEQWLLLDLRDVELPILPPNISTKQHFTLTGNFCLQMMQIVDISKPKLWQLQKIRNSNALTRGTQQDSDIAGTGKRVLQMTLTDGVQEIEAMEYQPVPCLSLNLSPGVKIRILGPVVVRRGRLMLKSQNVKLLGGEVEELSVTNAAENVLAKYLKLPQNPNPGIIQEKLLIVENEDKSEGYVSNLKPPQKPKNIPEPLVCNEDELTSEEMDMLLEAEEECQRFRSDEVKTPDFVVEADFDNINRSSTSTQLPQNSTISKAKQELSMLLDEDDDVFKDIDIDAHLDKLENLSLPKPNVITIAKLLELKSNVSKGVFKIRAKFKGVEEKLTISDGQYKLVIKVEDSTGELVVKVHSDVIANFAECSIDEVVSLKSSALGKDKNAAERILKIIVKVKDRLLVLDDVMEFQIERDKIPVLTKIL